MGDMVGRFAKTCLIWAAAGYILGLPLLIAWDGWRSLQACAGHPCGIYQDIVWKSPFKSRPHINLGRAYFLRGHLDLALQEYQQAELVSFNEPEIIGRFARVLARSNISDVLMQWGQMENAHQVLKAAWTEFPYFPGLAINLSVYYLTRQPPEPEKAAAFLTEALAHLDDFHSYNWDEGKLLMNRAIAEQLLGQCDKAIEDWDRARKIDADLLQVAKPCA